MVETFRLSNGVEMPLLGYGVFQVSPEECERCVSDALSVGYRLIDTAQAYFNEEGVGNAWRKSGLKREDLFLVTKVWISNNGEEKAAKSIDESLKKLQTEYIDLLLIHQAYGDVFGTWRAMEKAYRAGKVRAIGVSNFQAARFFDFAHYVEVKPMVNQLQCNVMIQQTGIEPILAETDTKMMAWGHYWSWDPKETWAAITWFAYLIYVHYRQIPTHKPKLALWVLLVSFLLLQMCWWGINYLPSAQSSSVHVYGQ